MSATPTTPVAPDAAPAPSDMLRSLARMLAPARTHGLELTPAGASRVIDLVTAIAQQAEEAEQMLLLLQAPPGRWLH